MNNETSPAPSTGSLLTIAKAIFTALPFIFFLTYVNVSSKRIQVLQSSLNAANNHSSDSNQSLKVTYIDTGSPKTNIELHTLQRQNASLKDQLAKLINSGNSNNEVSILNNNLQNQINDLQAQNNILQGQLNRCEVQKMQLTDQNKQLIIEVNNTTTKPTSDQTTIQQLTTQLRNCGANAQQIQSQLKQCMVTNSNLQKAIDKKVIPGSVNPHVIN